MIIEDILYYIYSNNSWEKVDKGSYSSFKGFCYQIEYYSISMKSFEIYVF